MIFDPLYFIIILPGILLGVWAQIKLHSAYGKYSQIAVESGMTGAEAARRILDDAGLVNVPVEEIPGRLSDHYDPAKHALFLSSDNFSGRTIAAVGVGAHEAGHPVPHWSARCWSWFISSRRRGGIKRGTATALSLPEVNFLATARFTFNVLPDLWPLKPKSPKPSNQGGA